MRISDQSLQHVPVRISNPLDTTFNPTSDTVQMAFLAEGVDPAPSDWQDATWTTVRGSYYANCLVGPGGTIQLAAGTYVVWVMVTDNPETPVLRASRLIVTSS